MFRGSNMIGAIIATALLNLPFYLDYRQLTMKDKTVTSSSYSRK